MNIEGAILGTYQIEKLLTSCRSGEVYQAQDLLLGRERVLLHCLNPEQETPEKVEELAARLAALGYVNQPGVVRVLNFFCLDEQYWVVTDCVGGWPLESYLDSCSPDVAANLWEQAGALVGYLHSFYGGYAHGSLGMESFRVGFDGKLHLIELGWLTGSFGRDGAMEADIFALEGLKQRLSLAGGTRTTGAAGFTGLTGITGVAGITGFTGPTKVAGVTGPTKAGRKKFTGTCPGCEKYFFTPVLFCSQCGYDLSAVLPCPLGLVLIDQGTGREVELLSAAQLGQAYPVYWPELETALVNGRLIKWLRELGETELVIFLERGLPAREDRSHLLARLIHRVLANRPASFWSEPAFLELGTAANSGKVSLYSSLGFVYGKVTGSCGKAGLSASPQVFGGRSAGLTVELDRSSLAPGRHRALLELEVNGRREFLELCFTVD